VLAPGTVANTFVQPLPPGFSCGLVDNVAQKRIDLDVVPSAPPRLAAAAVAGGNVAFAVTNGPANGIFFPLASTNVAPPFSQWTRIATNQFDGNGNSAFTNATVNDQNNSTCCSCRSFEKR